MTFLIGISATAAIIGFGLAMYGLVRIWRGARVAGPRGSVCGKCGYNVAGLPTFICPECGSDLREVGILSKTDGHRGPLPRPAKPSIRDFPKPLRRRVFYRMIAVIAAYLLTLAGVGWATLGTTPSLPGVDRREDRFAPQSGAFKQLAVRSQFTTIYQGTTLLHQQADKMTVQMTVVTNAGVGHDISINLPGRMASYVPAGGNATAQMVLDTDSFRQWMSQQAGVDVTKPGVNEEIQQIVSVFKSCETVLPATGTEWQSLVNTRLAHFRFDGFTGNSSFVGTGPATPSLVAGFLVASLAFAIGMLWIRRWGRQQLAPATGRITQPPLPPPGLPAAAAQVVSRTLTILFTDIEGYTDRAATSSRDGLVGLLRTNRAIVERAAARRRGRIVKSIGDALLATFESATDAVHAGLDIQAAVAEHCRSVAETDRFCLRIAVSTGEVTAEAGDVYGPAVNIASRVQALAEPGQVLFTEAAFHTMNIAEVPHEPVGEFELKGVPTKIRVYRAVKRDPARSPP